MLERVGTEHREKRVSPSDSCVLSLNNGFKFPFILLAKVADQGDFRQRNAYRNAYGNGW